MQIADVGKYVASQGFRALVPDLYRGKVAIDNENAGHLMNGLDWQGAVQARYRGSLGRASDGYAQLVLQNSAGYQRSCQVPQVHWLPQGCRHWFLHGWRPRPR